MELGPSFKNKWQSIRLGDHLKFLRNGANTRAELSSDAPVKYLHYGDIHGCANSKIFPDNLPGLPEEKAKSLSRLIDGDLVFADASEDLDGVGKSVEIQNPNSVELVSGQHTIAVRFNKSILADGFKGYLQFCPEFYNQLRRLAAGTKVYATNRRFIAGIEMHIPHVEEQKAIAEALSDVDALIDSLDRLIAKKCDLKQATMQQLLTGKTRLPGFKHKWKMKPIGEVLTICHGKSQHEVEIKDGPYPILATSGEIGRASQFLFDKPSVLIGRKGTINQPQYMDTPFWTVDTLFYSRLKDSNVAKFFYYMFCLIDWLQYNEASGVPSLNAGTIEKIEILCPEPEEQQAISDVLSDIDKELNHLENRLEKTKLIKQGMMQELLTGRTRLV